MLKLNLVVLLAFSSVSSYAANFTLNKEGYHQGMSLKPADRNTGIVDYFNLTNIYEIDSLRIFKSEVKTKPWDGSGWPLYRGGIAYRWKVGSHRSFEENVKEYQERPPESVLSLGINVINRLSPAEKYDLINGSREFNLTNYIWKNAWAIREREGSIEAWYGICDGWAAAASSTREPKKEVKVYSPIVNDYITFYPKDIKALVSYLYANDEQRGPLKIWGERCEEKAPMTSSSGRVYSEACFDINPADFHLLLINKIGKQKKTFLIDTSQTKQVWNATITGYELRYFNPDKKLFRKHKESAADAKTLYEKYKNDDPFRNFRTDKVREIVGVEVKVNYLSTSTYSNRTGAVEQEVRYKYDLELDDQGEIVGGEWIDSTRPDFAWKMLDKQEFDPSFGWDGSGLIPQYIRDEANESSLYDGSLDKDLVLKLIELAQ